MTSQCSILFMMQWCNGKKIHFTCMLSCLKSIFDKYTLHIYYHASKSIFGKLISTITCHDVCRWKLLTYENHQQKKNLKAMSCTFITESLIKSSSATSSNSDIGFSDNPKQILPLVSNLIWPVTWQWENRDGNASMRQTKW